MPITRNYTVSRVDMGYVDLAAAILRQAYIDYIDILTARKHFENREVEKFYLNELENFFESEWGATLSFGHGEELRDRALKTAISLKEPKKRYTHIKTYYHIRNAGDER